MKKDATTMFVPIEKVVQTLSNATNMESVAQFV